MTIFMLFQWLREKIKAGSARFASAVSQRTWVQRRSLSNRLMLKGSWQVLNYDPKSCKIQPMIALFERYFQRMPGIGDVIPVGISKQRHQPAAVTFESAGEFKLEQHGAHYRRRGCGHPDQIVERDRARSEQTDDAGAIADLGFGSQRLVLRLAQRKRP